MIVTQKEDNQYFDLLLQTIMWKKDEDIIFGKHFITKRKADWHSDSNYSYTIQTQQSKHYQGLNNFLTSSKWWKN